MSFSELKCFSDFSDNLLDDQLRGNLLSFFDWGFINKKAFHNVTIPASGLYGGNKELLKPFKDSRYRDGQVWRSFRSNWVWQSGLSTTEQPIRCSGVWVNNVFCPTSGVGPYSHYIDYVRGGIVFNTPIPTNSVVKAEYSYKFITLVDADEVPFVRQLQNDSFRLDSNFFSSLASGDYAILPDTRLQLPLVALEVTSDVRYAPYQLGGSQYTRTKVIAHVISDEPKIAKKIAMAISNQNEKAINTFDVNKITEGNLSPLNYKGSINDGALTHPDMVNQYEWKKLCITDMQSQEGSFLTTVYYVPVSFRAEVILNNI